jgi:hypothetical protein
LSTIFSTLVPAEQTAHLAAEWTTDKPAVKRTLYPTFGTALELPLPAADSATFEATI